VPTFCRHNRFIQNCPICRAADAPATRAPARRSSAADTRRASPAGKRRSPRGGDLRVRRVPRAQDDGYASGLVPGLRASADAARLADEIAFSAARLAELESDPPGLYARVGSEPERERATALAFLIAYLGPLEEEDPFASIAQVAEPWLAGELPDLADMRAGPRGAHDPARGTATLAAYRAWAQRAGSQEAAFAGEEAWTPERRFERAFERMAFPGLHRAARYDLLVTLGRLGAYDMRAPSLLLSEPGGTLLGAKRLLGIGDRLLLERRAADLAAACEVPVETLDLAFDNWAADERITQGARAREGDGAVRERAAAALGV
jgi:hypothetical protein